MDGTESASRFTQLATAKEEYPTDLIYERVLPDGRLAAVIERPFNTILIADIHEIGYEEQW